MKAALLKKWNEMEVKEIEKPQLHEGHALIKMRYAGVCGSDITVYTGKHPTATAPVVIGHEIFGTIEDIRGKSEFKKGDRVTVEPLISCGECEACRKGYKHVCKNLKLLGIHENGGYAEYTQASNEKLVKVPDTLSDELAALSEPFAVGYHVCSRAGVGKGKSVLVIGAGPIGLVVALSAQHFGGDVVVSEVNAKRLAVAEKLGINTVDPTKKDIPAILGEYTSGNGFDNSHRGFRLEDGDIDLYRSVQDKGSDSSHVSLGHARGIRSRQSVFQRDKRDRVESIYFGAFQRRGKDACGYGGTKGYNAAYKRRVAARRGSKGDRYDDERSERRQNTHKMLIKRRKQK